MAGLIPPIAKFSRIFAPPPDFGLIGLWPAASLRGAIISDGGGLNISLTATGSPTVVPSPYGLALSGAAFQAQSTLTMVVPPSITFAAWVNPTSVVARHDIISTGPTANASPLLILNTGGIPLFTKNGTAGVTSPVHVVAGQWAHIAGTYDSASATWAIYVNGAQTATSVSAQTWTGSITVNISDSFATWAGQIADARVYNRAISPAEVRSLYTRAFQANDLEPMAVKSFANAFNQPLAVTSTSTPTFLKAVGKVELITASSAVKVLKGCGKKLSVAATGTVGFFKGASKKIAVASAAVVSAAGQLISHGGTNHAQVIAVNPTSTVRFVKGLAKYVSALCNSLVSLVVASSAEPVIGDVSVVWSVAASANVGWAAEAQVTATMSQELQL